MVSKDGKISNIFDNLEIKDIITPSNNILIYMTYLIKFYNTILDNQVYKQEEYIYNLEFFIKPFIHILLIYISITPVKEKLKFYIDDLVFLLDKFLFLFKVILKIDSLYNIQLNLSIKLFTFLYKIYHILNLFEIRIFEFVLRENVNQEENNNNLLHGLKPSSSKIIEKLSFIYCQENFGVEWENAFSNSFKKFEDLLLLINNLSNKDKDIVKQLQFFPLFFVDYIFNKNIEYKPYDSFFKLYDELLLVYPQYYFENKNFGIKNINILEINILINLQKSVFTEEKYRGFYLNKFELAV